MTDYEPQQTITGLGCAVVAPTAIVGTMLLTEDHVAKVQVLTEFLGWMTLCTLVGVILSLLHKRFCLTAQFSLLMATLIGGVAFFVLTIAVAYPDTPDWVKAAFTTSLQLLGPVGLLLLVLFVWKARRSF